MKVPSESFCRSSWDSRTCYPWRATNQGLTDGGEGKGKPSFSFVYFFLVFLLFLISSSFSNLFISYVFIIDEVTRQGRERPRDVKGNREEAGCDVERDGPSFQSIHISSRRYLWIVHQGKEEIRERNGLEGE